MIGITALVASLILAGVAVFGYFGGYWYQYWVQTREAVKADKRPHWKDEE